jgi:hypothetical protein
MEEGLLSLMRRGDAYQVRYASTNPYALDPPPVFYHDTATLAALLHCWGIDAWSIHQAMATVRNGSVAVLPVHVTAAQLQAAFRTDAPQPPGDVGRASARPSIEGI